MRGRPILGVIAGFFFGAFLGLDLLFFKVVASDSPVLVAAPFVMAVLGLVLAMAAPFGGRSTEVPQGPSE
jgi:hypothetical protein